MTAPLTKAATPAACTGRPIPAWAWLLRWRTNFVAARLAETYRERERALDRMARCARGVVYGGGNVPKVRP